VAPLAIAGVALINTGLGRSRSAAQALLGNLAIVAVTAIVFALIGATFAGTPRAARATPSPGRQALELAWQGPVLPDWPGQAAPAQAQLELLFEFLAVALAALIPWGSGADRWRLSAGCAIAAVLAALSFPLAHWIWGGGWLAQLGVNFSLGSGFLDPGGAATVHVLGGLSALAVVWIAGPRRGKFPQGRLFHRHARPQRRLHPLRLPAGLVGWLAFNVAGAVLWLHAPLSALAGYRHQHPALRLGSRRRHLHRHPHPLRQARRQPLRQRLAHRPGRLQRLRAIVSPLAALFIGVVAGIITPLLVEVLRARRLHRRPLRRHLRPRRRRPVGTARRRHLRPQPGQFVAQLVGIATLLGVFLPLVYLLFWLLNRVVPFRVDPDGERIGMDLHELGGGAYPEFVIHRDDSYR
jgi:Amt family ammonium transporter